MRQPLAIFFLIALCVLVIDKTILFDRQSNNVLINQDNLRKFVNVKYGLDNASMINSYINALEGEQKDKLINEYLTNEALYNFALNRSLDKNDEDLKSVITAKSQNIIEMMINAEQPIPSLEDAKQYFIDNNDQYVKGESFNLMLINRKNESKTLLEKLQNEPLTLRQAVGLSDIINFDKVFRQADITTIKDVFGQEQATQIITQKDDDWSGPYKTQSGYHWVKVNRNPAQSPDFDSVKEQVINDLYNEKVEVRLQQIIADLIGQLNIRSDI
ncbi:peptidyl-prolyl cis-trans isomerase [Photobacterium makurazakiensis]|uniref:peptidylprolyl isomerase n=1 Tax=Photobacterium makurazakiensis TaxID=2910234 RepID=UPI003D12AF2B